MYFSLLGHFQAQVSFGPVPCYECFRWWGGANGPQVVTTCCWSITSFRGKKKKMKHVDVFSTLLHKRSKSEGDFFFLPINSAQQIFWAPDGARQRTGCWRSSMATTHSALKPCYQPREVGADILVTTFAVAITIHLPPGLLLLGNSLPNKRD